MPHLRSLLAATLALCAFPVLAAKAPAKPAEDPPLFGAILTDAESYSFGQSRAALLRVESAQPFDLPGCYHFGFRPLG